MNENINLCEILKDCPKGTKLYSPIFGEVEFDEIYDDEEFPITVLTHRYVDEYPNSEGEEEDFTSDGIYFKGFKDAECTLFPSKDQRDWSKWKYPKLKFDPKTLQPFDKVLCCDINSHWQCNLFSHLRTNSEDLDYPVHCAGDIFRYAIPYNDDTKHLVGTTDEAPEYYRYWES